MIRRFSKAQEIRHTILHSLHVKNPKFYRSRQIKDRKSFIIRKKYSLEDLVGKRR